MKGYNPQKIEKKWQKEWEKKKLYRFDPKSKKKKYYALIEFPYPSGDGLHVGHVRSYTAMDIVARKRRMQGHNVLYPIGWDAFGLPTENYAIKHKIHPKIVTKKNTDNFRRQLQSLGFSFDWSREINTTDPAYYRWTQWIFLKFFEEGLAYKARTLINWCTNCKIGLANEEVVNGHCERCGGVVEEREKEQWMLAITEYAESLLKGLKDVDYIPEAKTQQEHWIGKSEGAHIAFPVKHAQSKIEVFTTRPDTLYGATYLVLAPEHPLIDNFEPRITNFDEVRAYRALAAKKSEEERTVGNKEKTGVELEGVVAVHPITRKEIPVWISDYVLGSYGTGAIMAVPAHDSRDYEFARTYNLPIVEVVRPRDTSASLESHALGEGPILFEGEGVVINSGSYDGMPSEKAKWAITRAAGGKRITNYKLRDWIFSRQRYWGEPIPLVFCSSCRDTMHKKGAAETKKRYSKGELRNPGWMPVRERDLPVELPNVKEYVPTDTGESPLANISSWVEVKCPRCGGAARRETDVMPNWAGSSWYFLRYIDPKNNRAFADKALLKRCMPVDWYNGGMEHTVLHLLYSRFWNQFLHDEKLVPVREPYKKRTSHGLILGAGGMKMSKSKGNVVNPDTVVAEFGADALRMYEMFIGPFNQPAAWDTHGILGVTRFLERVWQISAGGKIVKKAPRDKELVALLHKTIKKVSEDIETLSLNTAVSTLMIFSNECIKREHVSREIWETYLTLLAPFAPHMVEELWTDLGNKKSIHLEIWPMYKQSLVREEMFTLVVQVNGKVRDSFEAPRGISQKEAEKLVMTREKIQGLLQGGKPRKVIFIPDRLINIVL